MKVGLPAPGGPLIPMRSDDPAPGSTESTRASASALWSERVDSTSVIAWARARRSDRPSGIGDVGSSPAMGVAQAWWPLALARMSSTWRAAAGMLVPGPKMAATPAS